MIGAGFVLHARAPSQIWRWIAHSRERLTPIQWTAVGVSVVAFALYSATLMPGVSFGDWAEFQTSPYLTGVLHPTGYPLYSIVGKVFDLVPIGSIAFRANLLSALCGSTALGVVTLATGRMGAAPLAAGSASLTLGTVPAIWSDAVLAEAQSLHLLLLALIFHRLALWIANKQPRDLIIGAFLVGLSLGNHMLSLTIAPVVILGSVWSGRSLLRAEPTLLLKAAAAFGLALLAYAYIPLAAATRPGPSLFNDPWSEACWPGSCATFEGFRALVLGEQFRSKMSFFSIEGIPRFVQGVPAAVVSVASQATPILPVLGLVGLTRLRTVRPAFAWISAAVVAVNIYVYANYYTFVDYLNASWLILGIWAAVGVTYLASLASSRAPIVALAALPVVLAVVNWAGVDQSRNRDGQAFVDDVFARLPPNAALLTTWDGVNPLWYAHFVEGRRPDILLINAADVPENLVAGRPLYALHMFDSFLDGLRHRYRLSTVAFVSLAHGTTHADHPRPLYHAVKLP